MMSAEHPQRAPDARAPAAAGSPSGAPVGPNVAALMGRLGSETSTLIRQEMNLLTVEMTEKASVVGKQAFVMAAGYLFCTVSLMAMTAALILGLSEVMQLWMAALVVGIALAALGYVVMRTALGALRRLTPTPTRTVATWKEGKSWAQALVR